MGSALINRVREITDKFIEIPEEFHNLLVNLSTADEHYPQDIW
jgi:hypothetical protein